MIIYEFIHLENLREPSIPGSHWEWMTMELAHTWENYRKLEQFARRSSQSK